MEYAQLNSDGSYSHQITTKGDVTWDATHTCPASKLTPEEAAFFRVVPLIETNQPNFDAVIEICQRDGGEFVSGQWQYKWTTTTLDAATAALNQAKKDAEQAKSVRASRNVELACTDWRYRRDQTTTPEWDAYCQALRDVPSQAGFPWTIVWPVQPE